MAFPRSPLLVAAALLLVAAAITAPLGTAATNQTGNVTVTVGSLVSITVSPATYNFTNVDIGDTNFSGSDALRLTVYNNGSSNISNIYAHPGTLTAEQDNPLGSGDPQEYAATSFLWIRNNTGNHSAGFFHAGALTWNVSEEAGGPLQGITNDLAGAVSHGFYRNTTGYYLWAMAPDPDTGSCADPGAALRIKTHIDDAGDRSLSTNVTTYAPTDTNTNWSQTFARSGPLKGHYVSLHTSCEKAYISRFDASPRFPITDTNQYLFGPANNAVLEPGERFEGRVGVAVPAGIPAGTTNRTVLTIHVSGVS